MTSAPTTVGSHRPGSKLLAGIMTAFGLFAIATGSSDVILGSRLLVMIGADLGAAVNEPWVDSQLRFLGAIWAGWGVLMIWACRDLKARGSLFDLLLGFLFVAACGRTISLILYPGSPTTLVAFVVLEFVLVGAGLWARRTLFLSRSRAA
ncbi:DUF4345 domain-containing protein [Aquabacter sp. CN5-332]|uniref:DUF4345 domain-containing protein n=1 Tax=Aquabacter sp. CN5-332 TaxID=3156608 RepID=UPI0032B35F5F